VRRPIRRGKGGGRSGADGVPTLLPKLRRGEIDASAFLLATHLDCERLVKNLLRSKRLWWWGEQHLDDIANYFRFELYKAVAQWDPARGAPLASFAIVRANTRTSGMVDRMYRKEVERGEHERPIEDSDLRRPSHVGVESAYFAKEIVETIKRGGVSLARGCEDALFDLDADLILKGAARFALTMQRARDAEHEGKMRGRRSSGT
jgi:hypothetical protein